MASTDRRLIRGLLLEHFPEMVKASSDEWHEFLNRITDLTIPHTMPNTSAFDAWRQALAKQGYPVWDAPAMAAAAAYAARYVRDVHLREAQLVTETKSATAEKDVALERMRARVEARKER